jgi:transketolase
MAKRSMRYEYGRYLVKLGEEYPNIVALEADLKETTQSVQFQQAYPDRYIETGIAEQNMVGLAAGLSFAGKIPITHSLACFTSMRACEQIRTSVAYPRLNVKLVAFFGGISLGTAGATHHAIEDIAIMRSIPNMTVLVPGDSEELRQVLDAALAYEGPVYIRLGADDVEDVYGETNKFSIGKATELRSGDDATIVTTGTVMNEGVMASDILLRKFGIKVRVLQMASVKPLDDEAVIHAAEETAYIVTVEEHNILGGIGSAVCEVVTGLGKAKVARIGVRDNFCGVGSASYLMQKEGITVENIINKVRFFVE